MKIIGLIGKANSGKTSSLRYAILQLLDLEGITVLYSSRLFSKDVKQLKKNIKNNWETETGHVRDITVLLEYKEEKICITTYGDSLVDILHALNKVNKRFGGCDIFVCGRHANNCLEKEFKDYTNEFYTISKERALSNETYTDENISTGAALVEFILDIID